MIVNHTVQQCLSKKSRGSQRGCQLDVEAPCAPSWTSCLSYGNTPAHRGCISTTTSRPASWLSCSQSSALTDNIQHHTPLIIESYTLLPNMKLHWRLYYALPLKAWLRQPVRFKHISSFWPHRPFFLSKKSLCPCEQLHWLQLHWKEEDSDPS